MHARVQQDKPQKLTTLIKMSMDQGSGYNGKSCNKHTNYYGISSFQVKAKGPVGKQ